MMRRIALIALLLAALLSAGCGKQPEPYTLNQGTLPPTAPADAQPGTRKMTKISVEEAKGRAPFKVLQPMYLPQGARYVETRYIDFDGQVFVVLQYGFEGQARYFQVDQYPATVPETDLPGTQELQIGNLKGQALFQHGFTMIRWTQDGTRLMLNGAIDEAEALKVARSFK